jgi:hypothetical protein
LAHGALYLLEHEAGWRVTTDPLSAPAAVMTVLDARGLAWELTNGPREREFSNDELRALRQQLQAISKRPGLVDAFLANMTSESWARLCNTLGRDLLIARHDSYKYGVDQVDTAAIEYVFAELGGILFADRKDHPRSDAVGLTGLMDPFSAALLVRNLHLGAVELAEVSVHLVKRAVAETPDYPEWIYHGPGTADILMGAMLLVDGSSTAFVKAFESQPEMLLSTTANMPLLSSFLRDATNPQTMHDASNILKNIIVYATSDDAGYAIKKFGDLGQYGEILCDITIPWLPKFTGFDNEPWALGTTEGAQLLLLAFNSDDALTRLVAQQSAVVEVLRNGLELEAYAATVGLVNALIRQVTINGAQAQQAASDLNWMLISLASALVPGLNVAQAVGMSVGLVVAQAVLQDGGTVESVVYDTLITQDFGTALAASAAVRATFDMLVEEKAITRSVPPPPTPNRDSENPSADYAVDFNNWLAAADLTDSARDNLDNIDDKMIAGQQTGRTIIDNAEGKADSDNA